MKKSKLMKLLFGNRFQCYTANILNRGGQKMKQYDLIAFDMDGTLLNSEKKISKETEKAINRAIAYGKTVILSTGRGLDELNDYKEIVKNIRYYVCEAGAFVYDSKQKHVIHADTLSIELAKQVFKLVAEQDTMIYYIGNGRGITEKEKIYHMDHYQMAQYQDMLARNIRQVPNILDYYKEHSIPLEKINVFCTTGQEREKLRKKLNNLNVTITYSEETSMEIMPKGVSKASGLKALCRYLDIDIEQTIAVGDSDNDREILKTAGLSVAMGNALQDIKQICDVIVPDNDHNGCVEAIDQYLIA